MAKIVLGEKTTAPPVKDRLSLASTSEPVSVDSLQWANDILDRAAPRTGKKWDTTNIKEAAKFNKMVAPAVTHIYQHISKYKPEIDAAYAEKKRQDPNFKGFTPQELDAFTNGEGQRFFGYLDAYDKYRNMTKIDEKPVNKISIGTPSFGPSRRGTQVMYYTPDMGAATIKNIR